MFIGPPFCLITNVKAFQWYQSHHAAWLVSRFYRSKNLWSHSSLEWILCVPAWIYENAIFVCVCVWILYDYFDETNEMINFQFDYNSISIFFAVCPKWSRHFYIERILSRHIIFCIRYELIPEHLPFMHKFCLSFTQFLVFLFDHNFLFRPQRKSLKRRSIEMHRQWFFVLLFFRQMNHLR